MRNSGRPARSILIVHRYFWPENISETPLVLRAIAERHLQRGDVVRVVTGATGNFRADWDDAFGGRVAFRSFHAPVDRGSSNWRRVINSLRLLWLASAELMREPTDLLYVLSYPPLVGGVLIALGHLSGRVRRSIYIVQDLFTYRIDNPVLRRAYLAFSGFTLARATRTVTLSEAMKRQLLTHVRAATRVASGARIAVVPNFSSELDMPFPAPSEKVYDVIYAGAHGRPQNLSLFVAALGLLAPEARPRTIFYGSGASRAELMAQADELALGAILQFLGPVSRQEIAAEIGKAHFGLVGALPDLMDYAFPSKLATYAALGVPSLVMCADQSETAAWLRETGLGFPLDPTSPERAAAQLARLFAVGVMQPDPAVMREAACRQFSKQSYLAGLDRVLDELDLQAG